MNTATPITVRSAFLMCLLTAFLGASAAILLCSRDHSNLAAADDGEILEVTYNQPALQTAAAVIAADNTQPQGQIAARQFSPEEQTNISVYENVNRSVVNINTKASLRDPLFMFEQTAEGLGSGSVLDKRGHILTNHHVISGAQIVGVTLADGNLYEANVVGSDPQNDIAVLKIDAPPDSLFPVSLGDSSTLKVGQHIFVIGNPFGLERTLTTGIISSLNRTLPSKKNGTLIKGIIQIDAALNQGNSGGPLLDSQSNLIGMNTAIANPSRTGESTGVGFSIPVNTIRRVVPQLIQFGKVIRADIGITLTWNAPDGLGIALVEPNGPAERAGLRGIRLIVEKRRRGAFVLETRKRDFDYADRILAVDSEPVKTSDDLQTILESKRPGDEVIVRILRDGKPINVPVKLGIEK